jgi:outer membrane protein insertion porin family
MRTILALASILVSFSTCAYAGAGIISNVSIAGLQNVKPRSVLSVVNLRKGKCYSSNAAKEDVRSILETGYFDNAEVHFNSIGGNLTFVVVEKPYIKRIVFNGNLEFSDRKLKRESVLKERNYYDFSKLEEAKENISALYRDKGYVDCKIEAYPVIDVDTNKMTITFLIIENNKIVIEEIKIEGIVFFKEKEILKLMKTSLGKIFKEDTYQADLKLIEMFYKNSGFMDYKFISSSVVYNDARTKMFLTLNISEGSRYKVGSIAYDGNYVVDNKEIEKTIKFKTAQIFSQNKITETMNAIYSFYYDRGCLGAEIVPHFNKDLDGGIVDVNLSIKENSVLYVKNIYIDGLILTNDKVVRRELLVNPGEVLTDKKLLKSIEKIYNLGFVDNVEYQVLATDKPGIVDLTIFITERDSGTITGGFGYSLDDKFGISTQIQHINMFGLGQKLSLCCESSKKRKNYEIGWTEPWVFNRNVSLTLNAFYIRKDRDYVSSVVGDVVSEDDNAYKEDRIGFAVKTGSRINDYVSLFLGYNYEYVKLSDVGLSVKAEIEKNFDLSRDKASSVFIQSVYDSRDYVFNPSRGSVHIADLNLASSFLGGNVDFVKGTIKSTWFFPIFWKFVLSVNLQSGAIIPYGGQLSIPVYNRFYLGGSDTVRGYAFKTEIGPKNGGTIMGFMNIEYKFPIFFDKERELIQGIIFYDIGGSWENYNDINLIFGSERKNIRSGIGFEMKFMTPMFPLKFGWGYGLNHKKEEKVSRFYFSIGGN